MLPRLALPPSPAVLALIVLAFVVPGLVGHDPWRAFDVIAIELVSQMRLTGDWVVPRLAGDPWLEDPPFYHWLALAFAKPLGGLLGFHNAVRLASGFAVLLSAWFLFLAGRTLEKKEEEQRTISAAAPLLLVGSVGLIVHAHEAVPDLATLAASCAALLFLFLWNEKPVRSGAAFGVSLGIAFLSTGPVMPAVLLLAALLAHAACDEWRNARAARFLVPGLAAFLVAAASWPLALWLRAPELASAWWFGTWYPRGEFLGNLNYYLATASWAAWPAWPLAGWAIWSLRREWRAPRVFVPLAAALLALPAIALAGPQQDINSLALIAPLALLGAQGVPGLRRGAANALDWFGVMTFAFFAGLVWLGYIAMMTGVPPKVLNNMLKTAPGFVPQFEPAGFAAGLALALAWLYLAFFTAPSACRSVVRWAAGVTLLWGTAATLLMPWADHIRSYRGVALQLKAALPPDAGCVSQRSLGAPQRAALSYHAGIRTRPAPRLLDAKSCPLLVVQGSPRHEQDAPGAGWRKLADVGRPGDRGERYRLYRRGG
jgi:4-amino-4-deoxy-L-arabinose transferase-like glycosyltransferase